VAGSAAEGEVGREAVERWAKIKERCGRTTSPMSAGVRVEKTERAASMESDELSEAGEECRAEGGGGSYCGGDSYSSAC